MIQRRMIGTKNTVMTPPRESVLMVSVALMVKLPLKFILAKNATGHPEIWMSKTAMLL